MSQRHLFIDCRVTDVSTVKEFLDKYYRRDRYTGWGEEYAACLLAHHEDDFVKYGYDCISHYDSRTGEVVAIFDEQVISLADALDFSIGFATVAEMKAWLYRSAA
jgi:hypothetical protein